MRDILNCRPTKQILQYYVSLEPYGVCASSISLRNAVLVMLLYCDRRSNSNISSSSSTFSIKHQCSVALSRPFYTVTTICWSSDIFTFSFLVHLLHAAHVVYAFFLRSHSNSNRTFNACISIFFGGNLPIKIVNENKRNVSQTISENLLLFFVGFVCESNQLTCIKSLSFWC